MLWAFFAFGTVWFWILSIVWIVLLTFWVDCEDTGWALGSVVVYLGTITLFGDINVFTWLKDHPSDSFRLILLYAAIGVMWGIAKFYLLNSKFQRQIERYKKIFLEQYTADSDEDRKQAWTKWIDDKLEYSLKDKMKLSNQANKVIFWIAYWPVSSVWTILNDPLRRFGKLMYHVLFVKVFEKIHEKTVGKAMDI